MSDKAEEEHADTTDGNTSGGAKKGKKGKSKGKGKDAGGAAGGQPAAALSPEQQDKLRKAMELLNLQSQGTIEKVVFCIKFLLLIKAQQRRRMMLQRSLISSGRLSQYQL